MKVRLATGAWLLAYVIAPAQAETCLSTTNAQAASSARTPEAVVAALAGAEALKPRFQRFGDRLIVTIDIKRLSEDLLQGGANFGDAVRYQAVRERFAYAVCDIVRPIFAKFREFQVVEVHGYLIIRDRRRGDEYEAKQMWAAYRRATAEKIHWLPPERTQILDVIKQADGYSLEYGGEFGRF